MEMGSQMDDRLDSMVLTPVAKDARCHPGSGVIRTVRSMYEV
jgi:hypothetical protein